MHSRPRTIQSQPTNHKRTEAIDNIKSIKGKLLLVTSHPALESSIDAVGDAGAGIEAFFWEDGVFLAVIANEEDWREGV